MSSPSIKEKASQARKQRDEGQSDLEQGDDTVDDSASSYYTALCSLKGITSKSSIKDTIFSQEFKTQGGTGKEALPEVSIREQDKSSSESKKDSLLLESKSEQQLSGTTKANVDLEFEKTVPTNTILNPETSEALNLLGKDLTVKPWDYFGGSRAMFHTNIRTAEEHSSSQPRFTSNTILITPDRNQYSKGRQQEYGDTEPKEDHTTQKQSLREVLSAHRAECRLDRGGHILGHMIKGEGQGRGVSCRKEQAELSLRSRNRKASASCISTPTAGKQESRIPPHCYSECIPATRNQHQSQSLPDTRRIEKQSRQGAWLSRPLFEHCHITDSTRGTSNMGTKLAEASSKVGGLGNLAQVRSSCSEADYLHVFSSSCRPSSQLSTEGSLNNWTEDVFSFNLPLHSNNQNTSACSEASSFECIDVALDTTEEVNRRLKTVPKRQIQLKRRDTAESQGGENNNMTLQATNTPVHPRDIFQRQHSTPAALQQESHVAGQRSAQGERKQRLQKSFSLDETSSKTKMASCIITNVLSKKMQHEQNLRTVDVSEKEKEAFTSIKVNNRATTKDGCAETTKLNQSVLSQSPPLKIETQTECSSSQKHGSVAAKAQLKPLSKHSFNPLLSGLGKSEVQVSGTEITTSSENEKAETLSPREEVVRLPNRSPGAKLSCDSAKGKAWNSNAPTNVASSSQASVKTTSEECYTVQRIHKQHNVSQTLTNVLGKQEQQGNSKESTLSTKIACLSSDLEANAADNTIPQAVDGGVGKKQDSDQGELKPPGHFASLGIQSQGKLKAMAPVHVVRDMRSLVKNTYNLSFKGPGESAHGIEESASLFQPSILNQSNSKSEVKGKGYRQDEKPLLRKITPPLSLDRMASHQSALRGCSAKAMPTLESNDKSHTVGFSKVSPISVTKPNSCALSSETHNSHATISKADVLGSDANLKQAKRSDLAMQSAEEPSTKVPTKRDSNKVLCEKSISSEDDQRAAALQSLKVPLQYHSPTANSEQQDRCKIISDGQQTPCLPPRSQSSVGPLSACVLTVASTPMVPSYYYNANPLPYQTITPHIGAVHGYVQGPVLFQTPFYNQPAASNSHAPLLRSLSEDGKMLVQQCSTDGPTKQAENEEAGLKMPSPETQHNTIFVAPSSAEARHGGVGVLHPEAGGNLAAGQNPRHLLLDPETGHCFYVDMPQLPQRKMLFDPETCQYVEVLLPQQTVPGAVLPPPCAIPFASLHVPPMYTPQCLPYMQSHPQVLPPPGP